MWHYKRQYRTTKTQTLGKIYMHMRASAEIFAFLHSKTAISFNILLVLLILYLRYIYTFWGLKLHLHIYTINVVPCYYLWCGVIYKPQFTDKTLTLRQSMWAYMRTSGASELRKFSHFYILKLLFLSIFCWYFRYFVGTNDMLVGLHVPTKLRKSIIGGDNCPPPPPSGYANVCA